MSGGEPVQLWVQRFSRRGGRTEDKQEGKSGVQKPSLVSVLGQIRFVSDMKEKRVL